MEMRCPPEALIEITKWRDLATKLSVAVTQTRQPTCRQR